MLTSFAFTAVTIAAGNITKCFQCFREGTLAETDEGSKPIEEIKVGDKVLAYDEETGKQEYKRVVRLFRNESKEWTGVTVRGEEIISTRGHKYYLPETKAWVSAEDLKVTDKVLLSSGECGIIETVRSIHYDEAQTTYNFEVEDFHTYYVGAGVLVHNAGCGTKTPKDSCNSESFYIDGDVGPYRKVRVDVERAGSNRYTMHLQYKGGPGSPAKLPFDTTINKFVGRGADVFNMSSKVRRAVISASKYIKGLGGVLHW